MHKFLNAPQEDVSALIESFIANGEGLLIDMYIKRRPGFVDVFIWSTSVQNSHHEIESQLLKLQLHFEALRAALPELSKALKGRKIRYALRSKGEIMQRTAILGVRHDSKTIIDSEISEEPPAVMDAQLTVE